MNKLQRYENQDRWPNVPFVEPKAFPTLGEAAVWAVLFVAFIGTLGLYLGAA